METLIKKAAEDLSKTKNAVALTGAGISVESGIPPFRGKGGLWEKFDPMEYAHIDAFMKDPAKVWQVLLSEMREIMVQSRPNDAHLGISRLEEFGILTTIITQNVDGLHQRAGNTDVIEFHGTFAWNQCMECKQRRSAEMIDLSQIPPRCDCGGIYKPEVVFFGEMIPPEHLWRSRQAAQDCELMLVVGTSATVQPASFMPVIAKESGATVIEINPEPTPLTGHVSDYLIQGPAGKMMRQIIRELELLLS
jgi:NAD-dependent protein deacetylase/lipoamidase